MVDEARQFVKAFPYLTASFSSLFLLDSRFPTKRQQLTNVDDCIKKGYIPAGSTPLEVASQQLLKDGITVIHTIGGDDTNTQAAHLSDYLKEKHDGKVIVIGMPKVRVLEDRMIERSTSTPGRCRRIPSVPYLAVPLISTTLRFSLMSRTHYPPTTTSSSMYTDH